MEQLELSHTTGGNAKNISANLENSLTYSHKVKHTPHSAVPLLGISPGGMKTYTHTKIWALMFSVAYS